MLGNATPIFFPMNRELGAAAPESQPPSLSRLLAASTQLLSTVSDTPRLDAELLLAQALGFSRARLLASLRDEVAAPRAFEVMLARRLNHEPIAYILGTWEFYSLEFAIHPPILVPRPETEHLVETALDFLKTLTVSRPRVLDLCTGSGCVAIAIAKNHPECAAVAVDIRPDAVALARENAQRHQVLLELCLGDLFHALPRETGGTEGGSRPVFDLIVSNPPYVAEHEWGGLSPVIRKHEDHLALLSGPDGLDCIRRIIQESPQWLRSGGMLALEMGEQHAQEVTNLFQESGFGKVSIRLDLAGHPRIAQGVLV